MVDEYGRNGPFNTWAIQVIKIHNRDIRRLYCVKDIDWVYSLEMYCFNSHVWL